MALLTIFLGEGDYLDASESPSFFSGSGWRSHSGQYEFAILRGGGHQKVYLFPRRKTSKPSVSTQPADLADFVETTGFSYTANGDSIQNVNEKRIIN
jgi:hypothetical protein